MSELMLRADYAYAVLLTLALLCRTKGGFAEAALRESALSYRVVLGDVRLDKANSTGVRIR